MALPLSGMPRLSDVMEHGRMDAGFLIALTSLRDQIDALRIRYTDDEAIAIVDEIPLADKTSMKVLSRGSMRRSMSSADAQALAREYPHLSLALIAEDAQDSVQRIRSEIARSENALRHLLEISEMRIPRSGDACEGAVQ